MANLSELMADPKRKLRVKQRQVAMEFGFEIERLMKLAQVKKIDLAGRLGKSRSWVSKLLFGPRNMKLFTAVEVADALNCDVELRVFPRQVELRIGPFLARTSETAGRGSTSVQIPSFGQVIEFPNRGRGSSQVPGRLAQ